jgi:hypothetical protein
MKKGGRQAPFSVSQVRACYSPYTDIAMP